MNYVLTSAKNLLLDLQKKLKEASVILSFFPKQTAVDEEPLFLQRLQYVV